MRYHYCVVWFERAKTWIGGSPRPFYSRCKMFYSKSKAEEFANRFISRAKIYTIDKKREGAKK